MNFKIDNTEVNVEQLGNKLIIEFVPKYVPKRGDFVRIDFTEDDGSNPRRMIVLVDKIPTLNYFKQKAFAVLGSDNDIRFYYGYYDGFKLSPATEGEKQLLLDKLKEAGKQWNAENMEIEPIDEWVDFIPTENTVYPFIPCIVSDYSSFEDSREAKLISFVVTDDCPFIALLNNGTTECFEYCKIKKQSK